MSDRRTNLYDYFKRKKSDQIEETPETKRLRIGEQTEVVCLSVASETDDKDVSERSNPATTNETRAPCLVPEAMCSDAVPGDSDTVRVSASPCASTSVNIKNQQKDHVYLPKWATKWTWLSYKVPGGMFCTLCEKHRKRNTFTSGCRNYRTSTLERHTGCKDHREAVEAELLGKDFEKAAVTAAKKNAADPLVCVKLMDF